MSNLTDTSLDLEDLELQLLPAWARQAPDANRYAGFRGGGEDSGARHSDRSDRRGPRPDRDRGFGGRGPARQDHGGRPQRDGDRRGGQFRREERPEPAPAPAPLELSVAFIPEEKGVESIARQIKLTGRAYPIFDIARLALRKPERYHVTFGTIKRPDGQVAQSLWTCNLDDTLWLSEQEAVDHVLRRHFETFYQSEKAAAEPPKGTYTFVAQCGLSGEILGPPNLNEVQVKMRKLHAERYARMPFDVYKSRVRIVKDEASVKKWIDEQSWKTEYNCLNIPEPRKLASREEVEKHFREVHQANIIRAVDSHTLSGKAAQQLPSHPLRGLLRRAWDDQSRFPLRMVTILSQQFANHGLQFFKVNKTVTHVAVARPHFLDVQVTPVSDGIGRIVDFINTTPYCTRKKLLDALAPSPAHVPVAVPAAAGPSETAHAPAAPMTTGAVDEAAAKPVVTPVVTGTPPPPTPAQTAVISDLHWLIHQGHVLEFANGKMETAKRPLPRPISKPVQQPVKRDKEAAVSAAASTTAVAENDAGDPAALESELPAGSNDSSISSEPGPLNAATPQDSVPQPDLATAPVETQPAEITGERA